MSALTETAKRSPSGRATRLLEVRELKKIYRGRPVVNGVSFHVEEREVVVLLGPNGAGKTTTFRMTNGLVRPDAGEVLLDGTDVGSWPLHRRARAGMGYLPQKHSIFLGLTAENNLMAILEFVEPSRAERRRRRDALLEEFGLTHVRKSPARYLSGGETRRLEIARCLIPRPRIILLDEPFTGIDPIAVAEIQEIVRRLKDHGITILMTDHQVRETLAIADRVHIMASGRLLVSGSPEEILQDKRAREAYLGEQFHMDLEKERQMGTGTVDAAKRRKAILGGPPSEADAAEAADAADSGDAADETAGDIGAATKSDEGEPA